MTRSACWSQEGRALGCGELAWGSRTSEFSIGSRGHEAANIALDLGEGTTKRLIGLVLILRMKCWLHLCAGSIWLKKQ
ncbi:MAG TPA: hypothetical protein QF700_12040 [Prochlorococcus sp.]|nr:hypothetical protein [Prochlorococcus sp.]